MPSPKMSPGSRKGWTWSWPMRTVACWAWNGCWATSISPIAASRPAWNMARSESWCWSWRFRRPNALFDVGALAQSARGIQQFRCSKKRWNQSEFGLLFHHSAYFPDHCRFLLVWVPKMERSNASLVWTAMLFVGRSSDIPHSNLHPPDSHGYVATHSCIVVHAFVFLCYCTCMLTFVCFYIHVLACGHFISYWCPFILYIKIKYSLYIHYGRWSVWRAQSEKSI